MENNLFLVKVFIEASSKDELISLQLKNNFVNGFRFMYGDPVKEGKSWVVWYFADVGRHVIGDALKEQLKKDREPNDSIKE